MKYTIWVFDMDGTASGPVGVLCDTDAQALAAAEMMLLPNQSVEVRHRGRLVGRIGSRPPEPA